MGKQNNEVKVEGEVGSEVEGEVGSEVEGEVEAPDTPTLDEGELTGNGANSVPETDTSPSVESPQMTLDGMVEEHVSALEDMPGFDPSVHATGPDGRPILKADGSFAKKRGRKPGQTGAGFAQSVLPRTSVPNMDAPLTNAVPSDGSVSGEKIQTQKIPVTSEATAKMCANLTFAAGTMVFGSDLGKPRDKDEAMTLKNAYRDYFDARGTPNLPPEIGLLIALGAYAAPRLQHESMAEKVKKWVTKIKEFFRIAKKDDDKNLVAPVPQKTIEVGGPSNTWMK